MLTFPFTLFAAAKKFVNEFATYFNGVDEWVRCGPNSITNDLSVFAWIRVPSNNLTRTIASNYHSGIGQRAWSLSLNATGSLRLRMSENGTSDAKTLNTTSFNVEDGEWHFVGFTFNTANQAEIYVDGVKETSYSGTDNPMTNIHNSTTDFSIGALRNGSEKGLGHIDEVTVWKDTVLSDSEITNLYNSGVPTNPTKLSTSATLSNWYRMGDADTAPTIVDHIGGIDGTMISMDQSNFTRLPLVPNLGVDMNGVDEYVKVSDISGVLPVNDFTLHGWFKLNAGTTTDNLISKFGFAGSYSVLIAQQSTNKIRVYMSTDGSALISHDTPSTFARGGWRHVALTYGTAGELKLYVDGNLELNQTTAFTTMHVDNEADSWRIGAQGSSGAGASNFLDGVAGSCAIYNKELSLAEVQEINDAGKWGDTQLLSTSASLVWLMNGGDNFSANTLPDVVGSNTIDTVNMTASNMVGI